MNLPARPWLSQERLRDLRRAYPWWPAAAVVVALFTAGSIAAVTPDDPSPRPRAAAQSAAAPGQGGAATEPVPGEGADDDRRLVPADPSEATRPASTGQDGDAEQPPVSVTRVPLRPAAGMSNPKSVLLQLPAPAGDPVMFPSAGPLQPSGAPGGFAVPGSGGVTPAASGEVYALIQRYFPPSEWDRANRVSQCESGQRSVISAPNRDGSRDYGVFQLNSAGSGGTLEELLREDGRPETQVETALDPDWNVRAAAALWQQRGWQPWTCAAKIGID